MTILVTGSTGKTSSRVAALLHHHPNRPNILVATRSPPLNNQVPIAALTHPKTTARFTAPAVPFDWLDPTTHSNPFTAASDPITAIYLVAPNSVTDPVPVMKSFIESAVNHGVKRFVLLSASPVPEGGPLLGGLHAYLHERGDAGTLSWAVIRPTWFMQNLAEQSVYRDPIRVEGVIRTATGGGRVPFVDAGDIANVAVHALLAEAPPDRDYVVVGPELLRYRDCAQILGRELGREVVHDEITAEERRERYMEGGMGREYAAVMAGMDGWIKEGKEEHHDAVVQVVTGVKPRSFTEFVRENRAVWMP